MFYGIYKQLKCMLGALFAELLFCSHTDQAK